MIGPAAAAQPPDDLDLPGPPDDFGFLDLGVQVPEIFLIGLAGQLLPKSTGALRPFSELGQDVQEEIPVELEQGEPELPMRKGRAAQAIRPRLLGLLGSFQEASRSRPFMGVQPTWIGSRPGWRKEPTCPTGDNGRKRRRRRVQNRCRHGCRSLRGRAGPRGSPPWRGGSSGPRGWRWDSRGARAPCAPRLVNDKDSSPPLASRVLLPTALGKNLCR